MKKILVANRGEIACRVMRSCRRLGLSSVAVYSEADEGAFHTTLADEAQPVGPAQPMKSYLVVDNILAAGWRRAERTRCIPDTDSWPRMCASPAKSRPPG